jgi:hypothetical protein
MSELFEMVVALLASIGVISIIWIFLEPLLCVDLPVGMAQLTLWMDEDVDIRQAVSGIDDLRRRGVEVTLSDDALSPEPRRSVVILCRNDPTLSVCSHVRSHDTDLTVKLPGTRGNRVWSIKRRP